MTSLVIPNPNRPYSDITLLEAFVECPYEAVKFEESCIRQEDKKVAAATAQELEINAGGRMLYCLSSSAESHFIRATFYYFSQIVSWAPKEDDKEILKAFYSLYKNGRTVADAIAFAQKITAASCPERQEQVAWRMQRNLSKFAAKGKEFPSKSYCGVLNI